MPTGAGIFRDELLIAYAPFIKALVRSMVYLQRPGVHIKHGTVLTVVRQLLIKENAQLTVGIVRSAGAACGFVFVQYFAGFGVEGGDTAGEIPALLNHCKEGQIPM